LTSLAIGSANFPVERYLTLVVKFMAERARAGMAMMQAASRQGKVTKIGRTGFMNGRE
jgi:hypothetical protein